MKKSNPLVKALYKQGIAARKKAGLKPLPTKEEREALKTYLAEFEEWKKTLPWIELKPLSKK